MGFIYVFRDFAQREIKHWIFLAMLIGCAISWVFAEEQAAFASVAAFSVGELIDWGIFTYTKKPLSERILWSSAISAPVDSVVNLYLLNQLNWLGLSLMIFTKLIGVVALWTGWKIKRKKMVDKIGYTHNNSVLKIKTQLEIE